MLRRVIGLLLIAAAMVSVSAVAGPLDGLFGNNGKIDLGKLVQTAKQAFGDVSPAQEQAIGREAAAVLVGAAPLVQDDQLQRYVNRVGRWVALHTERPDLNWRFGVLDTMDINAFAAPGGYVFVTKGLLLHLDSEAELAGVLAHECAHVIRKHHLKAVEKGARLDLAVAVVGSRANEQDRSQLDKIAGGFKDLYARGLDKHDEYEADRLGIVIATRAGYDPYGLPAMLQTLEAMDPKDSALAFMFKTHPAPEQRFDRLEGILPPLAPYARQPDVKERFLQQMAAARRQGVFASAGPQMHDATDAAALHAEQHLSFADIMDRLHAAHRSQ